MTEEENMKALDDYHELMKQEAEADRKLWDAMKVIAIDRKGEDWYNELIAYLDIEGSYFSPIIVTAPRGDRQEIDTEFGELIKEEWVNQTTNGGYTGDEFAGTIYFKLNENEYIEFSYSM